MERPRNILKVAGKAMISVPRGLKRCGTNAFVSPWAEVVGARRISVGEDSVIERHARLIANCPRASIEIGPGTTIMPYALLKSNNGPIRIGENSSVNDYAVIYGFGGVSIGDDVHIAAHCVIVASEHRPGLLGTPRFSVDLDGKGIVIENCVWLGAHAVILDGVTIGTHAVVGAGAVVTRDVPAYSVVVGSPARVIKTLPHS